MQEICYCGRTGEIEDRKPSIDGDGREALECPRCGHWDHLSWLEDPESVFEEAPRGRAQGVRGVRPMRNRRAEERSSLDTSARSEK